MSDANVVSLAIFPVVAFVLCAMIVIFAMRYHQMVLQAQVDADVATQESEEEKRSKRKESILNGLNVKEWVPDGTPVEAPQSPAPPMKSSPALCATGSDDREPLAAEEEKVGCAICLSHFRPKQLICESNNSLCQHVFHKDCMVDWLMKNHDNCPMCREVYLNTDIEIGA
jgi:hypothetical protein